MQSPLDNIDPVDEHALPRLDPQTGMAYGAQIRHALSPNREPRPASTPISLLVIHNISLPPGVFIGNAVEAFFLNQLDTRQHPYYQQLQSLTVSAHFFIRRHGEIIQFVPCCEKAWHAGKSCWKGQERCNDFSIGIELEGTDDSAYTTHQYHALAALTAVLESVYPIVDRVGHCDIAPGRKTDPGRSFDWIHYTRLVEQKKISLSVTLSSRSSKAAP